MTLKRGEGCCVHVSSDNDAIDGLHYPTTLEAVERLAELEVAQYEMDMLAEPCWFVVCDHCEEEAEDDERGIHFVSQEEALKWMNLNGWTTDGIRTWCSGCSYDGLPLLGERIPVIPGQIPLEETL